MRAPNCGHALLSAGPFGISGNDTPTETVASSPDTSIAGERSSSLTTPINLNECHLASHEQSNPPSHPQQPIPAFLTQERSQPGFGLTWGQAEQAVSDFKIKYTPFFPFITLDPDVSAQEILSKKPLLFRAIMLTAAQITLAKQRELRRSILAYVGQHLLVMEERDLGLLQGLLVYIAWGVHDFYFDQKITYLIYLAMGYAHNLAITRPPPTMKQKMMIAIHPKDIKEAMVGHNLTTVLEESHTPEEQRAFLGCQYLLSVNSAQFGRENTLRGEYVDRCLNSLVRPTDLGVDFILDKMVRFQRLVEEITEKLPAPGNEDGTKKFSMSMSSVTQSIRTHIDRLFANMAQEHRQFVRLYLPASYLSQPLDEVAAQHQRQCMLNCLQAARSFFSAIISMGAEGFLFRSFISFSQILFVLVATSRLLLVEIEGWDLEEARRMLDFPSTLDSLISAFEIVINLRNQRAAEAAAKFRVSWAPDIPSDEKDDRFYKYSVKLQWIKNWFESQLSGGPRDPGETGPSINTNNWVPENHSWNPFLLGFLGDDNWNIEF
ncbi:hypothetical protein AAE478_007113 [Parahypoxylon ruwenzoriense]